jgi:heme exporter protein A
MPSPDAELRLSARGLRCRRGGRRVFAGLSFELRPGEVLELRGANGSGKTSLLRLLAGLAQPSGGALHWQGRPLLPGDAAYDLTAAENLHFAQRLAGGAGACADPAAALQAWGLAALAAQPARRLSQGQRRRLALARVWMGRRRLWLLDEPCAALDSAGERLFDTRLAEHLQAGGAAIVATHHALTVPSAHLRRLDLDALAPC